MEGFEVTVNHGEQFKKIITRLLDEKTIIIEDFIRKNDLTPKEIVIENKADIESAKLAIMGIIQDMFVELSKSSEVNTDNFQNIGEAIAVYTEKVINTLESTINTGVTDEIQSLKCLLKEYSVSLQGLEKLDELDNLSYLEHLGNLDILKKLESLESLDKLQDLDKLKDLSYIEHLKELQKLDKLEDVDFNDFKVIIRIVERIITTLMLVQNIQSNHISLSEDLKTKIDEGFKNIEVDIELGNKEFETTLSEIVEIITDRALIVDNNIATLKQIESSNYENLSIAIFEGIKQNEEQCESLLNQIQTHKSYIETTIIQSEIRIQESIIESSFIEVSNKNLLPNAGYHEGKKAIVYGGWGGTKVYRFNGKCWDKL